MVRIDRGTAQLNFFLIFYRKRPLYFKLYAIKELFFVNEQIYITLSQFQYCSPTFEEECPCQESSQPVTTWPSPATYFVTGIFSFLSLSLSQIK